MTLCRQRQGRQGAGQEEGKRDWQRLGQSAHVGDRESLGSLVEHARHEEHRGCDQAMAHHLEHGSADSQGINGTDPHQHKAHVAHGTAGNPAFDVVLGEGVERAVNDVHDPKDHQGWRQGGVSFWKHLHVEAQQGVAAHFQEYPGQQHRHRRVCLTVGIGQPGVEREHRQFHAEANQETHVTQQAEAAARGTSRQFRDVEGEGVP